MKPSRALRLIRQKIEDPSFVIDKTKKIRARGYKKKRGDEKQRLYDRLTAYALTCPLSTLSEIALDNNVSMNTVMTALKEAGIRKEGDQIGRRRASWIKILPVATCPDCDAAAKHAYADATTPGFFYSKCVKHRNLV